MPTFPKKEINGIYEIDCKEVDIWEQPLAVVQPFPFLSLPDVLRGRVLEFVLVASEGSTLRLPRGCFPDRVPYSAAASLRTLAFHSRSIKAVCKAVAGDTRLIERRIATPLPGSKRCGTATPGRPSNVRSVSTRRSR